jgi:BASS family bile acid:Na+ symporter
VSSAVLNLLIFVTLWGSVGGLALAHLPAEVMSVVRRPGLLARVAVFDLLVIPPVTWAVSRMVGVPDEFAIGLILVGATAAGPLGVIAVQLARGDALLAVVLVTFLEIANALAVPGWAAVLLPRSVTVPLGSVLVVVLGGVLAPLVVGLLVRRWRPRLADRLLEPARVVASVGLVAVVAFVLVTNVGVIGAAAAAGVPLATALVISIALAGGWVIGGPTPPSRLAVALVSAQRGSAVALAIAVAVFPDIPEAAVAVVAFGMISLVAVPVVGLLARGRV